MAPSKSQFPIKGFLPVTLLDWPGKIAAMIFTGGCNFRCRFCYNRELVENPEILPDIDEKTIFDHLENKKNWLDGLVISGGEPTIYSDLATFCQKVKKRGFKIQLQTNGTNPQMLKKLIKEKLVDCIAMDIKGPLNKYQQITGTKVDLEQIKKSLAIIKKNPQVEVEFRTTFVPGLLNKNDAKKIAQLLKGQTAPYFLQQFRPQKTLDRKLQKQKPYLKNDLEKIKEIVKKFKIKVEIRGV